MFRGLTAITLDDKGRISVPVRYREQITTDSFGQLVLTIDPEEGCLWLYDLIRWEKIEQKLQELPSFNPITRRLQRLLLGHATELDMDTNGRILLPPLLREYAGLEKKIMLVGQGNRFEIWSESAWIHHREQWLGEARSGQGECPAELRALSL